MAELTKVQQTLVAVIRLILVLLRSNGALTASELAEAAKVSRSSLYEYLKLIRAAGLVVDSETRGRSTHYRVATEERSPHLGPTVDEGRALALGRQALHPWDGSPQVARYDHLLERWDIPVEPPQMPLPPKQLANNKAFGRAVDESRWVLFRYPKSDQPGGMRSRTVKPKAMWISEGQSYIRGFCAWRGGDRTFKVCRASEPSVAQETFVPDIPAPKRLDPFRDDVFMGTDYGVNVLLSGRAAFLGREHPLLLGQIETELPDDKVEVTVLAPGLKSAKWWSLRWGAGAEVLGPPGLREMVAKELAEAFAQYGDTVAYREFEKVQ